MAAVDITNNPLLLKAEIGKPLRRGFTLPSAEFTYGKSSRGKMSGCADAMSSWPGNGGLQTINDANRPQRDFINLNKGATQCGLVTAPEQVQYRATHDATKQELAKHSSQPLKRLPPNMVYGVPTKPSTPVFDLLEHKYQDRWLLEKRKNELANVVLGEERAKSKSARGYSYCETRASRLRRYSPPVDAPPLWQMTKYQKVLPALTTFRSADARLKAFDHHKSDCTSRTGVFGHGTYEGAKC